MGQLAFHAEKKFWINIQCVDGDASILQMFDVGRTHIALRYFYIFHNILDFWDFLIIQIL